jgi:DNA polymerase
MTVLSVDIETKSSADLKKTGVYKYAENQDFAILLFAYAIDDLPVQVVDLTKQELPKDILEMLTDTRVIKTAFNANFERVCISKHFSIYCDPLQWRCTMVHATSLGLPNSLDMVAQALGMQDQKDASGKRLIKLFSCPPFKNPMDDVDKWDSFIEYCRQDVQVERAIRLKLERFPMQEWELWSIDQNINDYGVKLDLALVEQAIKADEINCLRLEQEYSHITKIANANSLQEMKRWLGIKGIITDSLTKDTVKEMKKSTKDKEVLRVLEIRQELAKTSVSKYHAMLSAICSDNRVRGLLQYYGARTGRWAGRLIQVQNLPQNKLEDLESARNLLLDGNVDAIDTLYGNVPDTLSQLIRTAILPDDGCRLIVSDFSSIEARVLAWLADEKWVMDVFEGEGKIYEATAAAMFNVPVETITKGHPNYEYRAKGKVACLACGYAGGLGALQKMGGEKMGLSESEMQDIVAKWRKANANIVKFWYAVENACVEAIQNRIVVKLDHGIEMSVRSGIMFIKLPSGRSLAYMKPDLEMNQFGKLQIVFMGMDSVTKQWGTQRTYSGKLVENIVQAVARDCLVESLKRLHYAGHKINLHVHDEIVMSVPEGQSSVEDIEAIMGQPIEWAKGLTLTAGGYECTYYRKD